MGKSRGRKKRKDTGKDRNKPRFGLFQPWAAVPVLVIVAAAIRLIPFRLKYLIGYDPYFHLAYIEYAAKHGWVNYFTHALGPWGFLMDHFHPKGMWLTPYAVHKLLGTSIPTAFKLTPVIFGVATVLAVYFAVRKFYSQRTAFLSAFFLAISFGHVFRSMADYYRGDNYALFWYSIALLFIAYGLSTPWEKWRVKKTVYYLFAGIAAGSAAAFWSAYYVDLVFLALNALFVTFYALSFRERRFTDALLMDLSVLVSVLWALLLGRIFNYGMFWVQNWQGKQLESFLGIGTGPIPDVFLALMLYAVVPALFLITAVAWGLRRKLGESVKGWKLPVAGAAALTLLVSLVWFKYGHVIDYISTGLSSFGGAAVAEMSRTGFADLKSAYSFSLLLLPFYFLSLRRKRAQEALILSVLIPSAVMIYYWTRFLFLGSLAIALMAGIGASEIIGEADKRKVLAIAVVAVSLVAVANTYTTVRDTHQVRPIVNQNWANALRYLGNHSNEVDVVLTWWDHGDWVTYFSERAPVAQGNPSRFVARYYLGLVNESQLLQLGVDFVTVSFDTMMKWGSVLDTAGVSGAPYALIPMWYRGVYDGYYVFSYGSYSIAVRPGAEWSVLVKAGKEVFTPEQTWVENRTGPVLVKVTGKKAGNAYVYVNFRYGYAVLMSGKTFDTTFARLMFTDEYPKNYELFYTDHGMVKVFRLVHPNVELLKENGRDVLEFTNPTGNTLRIYGFSDSGKELFERTYDVAGLKSFTVPKTDAAVIRYTYISNGTVLDRGVFRVG